MFQTSLALVLGEIGNIEELRRLARTRLVRFATDVCLVSHGVRAGYLVDAVFPPNPAQTFASLLNALRRKSAVFNQVLWWHHTPTAQSFLVHVPLLQERLAAVLRRPAGECVFFIGLDAVLSVAQAPSRQLREALDDVGSTMSRSPDAPVLFLPDAFTQEVLVPLAAVIIGYPVAYCPTSSAQTSFLDGEALDVYTVSVARPTPSDSDLEKEHVLLKFSCPQVLVSDHPGLSPGTLIEGLQTSFAGRLGCVGMQIHITHHTETLDRVAL